MAINYLNIQTDSEDLKKKVRQNIKFKTNKFVWKIKFNIPLNPKTVNNANLYVTASNQALLKTSITYDATENLIEITPLEEYSSTETYTLVVTKQVESKGGKKLSSPVKINFKMN